MQHRNEFWVKGLILLVSLIFCMIILEGLARWFFPAYNPIGRFIVRLDEKGRPFGLKNFKVRQWSSAGDYNVSISLNKYGFRDRKDLTQASSKDYFVVGNSFPFGWGVPEEKRFSNLLEPLLGVGVYNISYPGAGLNDLDLFVNYAEKNGAKIKRLIICVFMEYNIVYYSRHWLTPFTTGQDGPEGIPNRIRYFFWNHSTLFNVMAYMYHSNPLLIHFGLASNAGHEKESLTFKRTYSLPQIISTVQRVKEIARGYDATVLIIPSRFLWIGSNCEVENRIHREFLHRLQEEHFSVVDPRPYFEKIGNPLKAYFNHDGHWNKLGQRLAAQAIADQIKHPQGGFAAAQGGISRPSAEPPATGEH